MKNIVVTTDLSANSKSGIKFAIQLAEQYKVNLLFLHVVELLTPTGWSDEKSKTYISDEMERARLDLEKFVLRIYKDCRKTPGNCEFVARRGRPVSDVIIDFATSVGASFICIGTRGAGRLKRMIGTHASGLIRKSPIPVFSIPKSYRSRPIKNILYSSDLTDVAHELDTVNDLARKLNSKITVLHYEHIIRPKEAEHFFDDITSSTKYRDVEMHLAKYNWEETFGWHLKKAARKFKPDVMALFTNRSKSFLEKILSPSRSTSVAFDAAKPVLVYPKYAAAQ